MPRPTRRRNIERMPVYRSFSPDDEENPDIAYMTVDEYEAFRLLDDEGLTQAACAEKMRVSRTTVTAIYDSARRKIADALVRGKRLLIVGGCCAYQPVSINQNLIKKGSHTMRIAVTYDNGEVYMKRRKPWPKALWSMTRMPIAIIMAIMANMVITADTAPITMAHTAVITLTNRANIAPAMAKNRMNKKIDTGLILWPAVRQCLLRGAAGVFIFWQPL